MAKGKKIVLTIIALVAVWYIFCLPRQLFREPYSAVLESADGTLLGAHISSAGQWYFPPADAVPRKFADCIITYEDKRFRYHPGVDFLSIGRAVRQNFSRGEVVSGASTITMQVIRLSRPGAKRHIFEKIYEAVLATRLELRCSKKKILLLYASNAPFGGNVVGLEAAAWRYFGRPAEELSWAESATLAVLPNSPALIHPGRNRERLLEKRNFLLDKLQEKGMIDDLECMLAKDEPLPDKPRPMPDMAYHLLERIRAGQGSGKYVSTLDYDLQRRVNDIAANHFRVNHTNLVDNLAVLVVDVRTGEVKAYYGNTRSCGRGVRGSDVDMIPAHRSSGSTLKPLLYAAMLQDGSILPGTLIKDTPYNYNNFNPHNFNRTFDGAVPAHEVIERSLNVPSVRMLEQYGDDRFLELLHGLGFDTMPFDADHYGLSLILGGAEISVQSLARAYYRLAAKLGGDDIYEDLSYLEGERRNRLRPSEVPLDAGPCWLAFEALSDANRPEEEASWMDFSSGRKIAWKTGTSWGDRDAWSVGVTRNYVVAVWVGNSDGEGRARMTGVSYAAPVMFDVFSALRNTGWFEMPVAEMTQVVVCAQSGNPASDICPQKDTIWAPAVDNMPDECRYHRTVHLSADGAYQVNSNCCPVSEMREEVFFVLPPAQEWYYAKNHLDYRQLPPKHPLFDASTSVRNPIDIIYPQPGITIVATRGLDGSKKGAVFSAAHSDPGATLYWHLDDEYLGETRGEHELMVLPEAGRHQLTVMDGHGSRRVVEFISK